MKCLLRRGLRINFDLRPSLAPRSRLADTAAVFLGSPDFDSAFGKRQSRTAHCSAVRKLAKNSLISRSEDSLIVPAPFGGDFMSSR